MRRRESAELRTPLVVAGAESDEAPNSGLGGAGFQIPTNFIVIITLLVSVPIGLVLAVPAAVLLALVALVLPKETPTTDSPIALALFRLVVSSGCWSETITKLPVAVLPLLMPLVICAQFVGSLFQLSRRIRHGSVHGPGSGSDVVLRTPDACFAELHDYPFEPHYWEYEGMRLHYIDEGAGEGDEIVLMLHGGPSWSFFYRKVVPPLVAKGYRVICPDALGMGKSDKPVDPARYSYLNHAATVAALCDHLGLGPDQCKLTVVVHDWGGIYSLPALPKVQPKRLVLLSTTPGPGTLPKCGTDWNLKVAVAFWFAAARAVGRDLCIKTVIRGMTAGQASDEEVAATVAGYEAPHPTPEYKALVATWPCIYAHGPAKMKPHYEAAQAELAATYDGSVLIAMGDAEHLYNGHKAEPRIREWLARARLIERTDIEGAGHFTTECGASAAVAAAIGNFIAKDAL
eukprot:g367.t1